MLNTVVLVGRLTRDPELRYTQNNAAVTNFTLAVNRISKDQNGEQADFFNIVTWNSLAENVAQYTHKGSLVAVQGKLQSRTYDQDNQRKYVVEVVAYQVEFLSYSQQDQQQDDQYDQRPQQRSSNPPRNGGNRSQRQSQGGSSSYQNNYPQQGQSRSQNRNQRPMYDEPPMGYADTDDDLPF